MENTENFFESNLFLFNNEHCDCAVDTKFLSPSQPPETTIKVQAIPGDTIHFAFSAGVGLVRLGNKGALVEKNLLGSLISIKPGDTEALFNYFSNNGFLFKISDSAYEPIDTDKMFELIRRIRTTVELLSAMGAIRKDYHKILGLSLYLLFSTPIEINFSTFTEPYRTCLHPFYERLLNARNLPEPEYFHDMMFSQEYYDVVDTLVPPTSQVDLQLYAGCSEGSGQEWYLKGSSSELFINTFFLYSFGENETPNTRRIVDLLYHYFTEVGIVRNVKENGDIEYYSEPNMAKFTSAMKERIIEVARIVIAEEINANMAGIHPLYDAEKMTPSWHVDTLMAGLYFSIFYMKPDLELFRRCKQCGQFFPVKATSTRKIFCDDPCRNRYQQSMYRKRKREKEENI